MALKRIRQLAALVTLCITFAAWANNPTVVIHTDIGDITVELYPDAAPVTVANFLRYVDAGLYRDSSFYRVVTLDNQSHQPVKIEVIQGGRGMSDTPPPFPPIRHETTQETGLTHHRGVISMSRLEPGSASSEFFICVTNQPELDFSGKRYPDGQGFAAFGQVIDGMDVVSRIQQLDTDTPDPNHPSYAGGQMLLQPVRIANVQRKAH
ncbi:peptidylprolyl isomerase [Parahaliea mediterranea]|uniref:peptidylprolyl isomerase n=1 Tax=Parahaliea mediterranea TaxID=651086 RepID=UPI001F4DAAAF|nr:peptidylprolyl isomerase [Parahaliea mediterranea]